MQQPHWLLTPPPSHLPQVLQNISKCSTLDSINLSEICLRSDVRQRLYSLTFLPVLTKASTQEEEGQRCLPWQATGAPAHCWDQHQSLLHILGSLTGGKIDKKKKKTTLFRDLTAHWGKMRYTIQ